MVIPTLAGSDELIAIPIMFFLVTGVTLMVTITSYNRRKSGEVKAKEETRREVAAYVAEGTMTSEDAARILSADPKNRRGFAAGFQAQQAPYQAACQAPRQAGPQAEVHQANYGNPAGFHATVRSSPEVRNAWKEWVEQTSQKARAAAAAFRQTPPQGVPPGPGWQWVGEKAR